MCFRLWYIGTFPGDETSFTHLDLLPYPCPAQCWYSTKKQWKCHLYLSASCAVSRRAWWGVSPSIRGCVGCAVSGIQNAPYPSGPAFSLLSLYQRDWEESLELIWLLSHSFWKDPVYLFIHSPHTRTGDTYCVPSASCPHLHSVS